MGLSAGSPPAPPSINVTPLIDIVLVLLIVFIVLVPGLIHVAGVDLPVKPPPGEARAPEHPLVVSLASDGRCFLQREERTPSQLLVELSGAIRHQPEGQRKVFLRVAPELPHQKVVEILDVIQRAGQLASSARLPAQAGSRRDPRELRIVTSLLKSPIPEKGF